MPKIRKLGGASSEQDDTGKPVADAVDSDSTTDASANAGDEGHVAGAAAGSASSTSASDNAGTGSAAAGEQSTANKSEATSGTATEETKSDAANDTVTEESKSDAANGTATEESKSDVANGAVTEESKSDATHGTGAEESKADAVHGSNAGGSSVVGTGSVGIDESTGVSVEIEETKATELLEEETKLATESEIPKEEDEKKLEEKENRKTIYIAFGKGVKVTATLEDANAVPDDARLRVTEIDDDEMYEAYLEAMDEAEPEIEHTKDNTVLRDISFIMKDEDGEETEYEPTEGSVKITIEYLENHLQDWFGVEDAAEVKTYHLPLAEGVKAEGEKTIDVQNVKASDINVQELDSDVKTEKKVEVKVDSFSMFAMRRAQARTTGSISLDGAIDKITVIKINDEIFDPNKQYPRDAKIEFKMEYKFPESNKPVAGGIQTATYTLPDVLAAKNTSGDIWCSDYSTTIPAGKYEIKNGTVTFNYTTEFLTAHPTGISGTFSFKSGLSEASTTNKEEVKINFAGSGTTIPITIQLEEGKVSANKTYKLNEDGTIDFTIEFEVRGKDVKNLVLTDTQGSNLAFVDPAEFKLNGKEIASSNVTINGQTATINLGDVNIGKYKLTYKSKPKDKTITNGDGNKNTASFTWNGGNGETKDTWVKTKEKLLKKEGYVEGNIITWKITYVPGEWGSVNDKEFKDTLEGDQKYIGNYTVYYASDGHRDWVPEDDEHKIDTQPLPTTETWFKYKLPINSTMGAYRIVYQTEITKDLSTSQTKEIFKNKIQGDGTEADKEVVIDKTPTAPTNLDIVKKSGVANPHNRTATWTVTITPPEGKTLKNLVLRDELQDGSSWYIEDSVQVKSGSQSLEKDVDYTLQFIPREENNHCSKMIVSFKNPVTEVIEITYQSDYNNSTSTTWAKNKVQSSYTVDEKDYSEWDEGVVYFPENGKDVTLRKEKTGFSEGVATWKVKINDQDGSKRVQLSDELLQNIVDTLPEGMVYVAGSLKCSIHKSKYNGGLEKYDDVTVDFDEASRKLSVHINNLDISQDRYIYIELEYETRIKSIPETSGNGTTVNGNKVTFNNEVRVGNATASADVTLSNKVLDKKGKQAKKLQNVVEYTLGVNYGAADLLPEKDTLELSDILDANMTLDTGSIQVKDMYTGDAVAYKVSFGTTLKGENTITMTIPDERALLVTYNASLVTAGKDPGNEYKVTNSASLKGTTGGSVKEETKVKYQTSAATVTGTSNSITIKKVDEQGKSLSSARFVVQKVNPSTLDDDGEPQTITTDDLGTAKFTGLSYNTLYYYQETEAPSGYKKDETKHYFIIKNAANEEEFNQLTREIQKGTAYGTYPDGLTINVENKKIVGSLKLKKVVSGVEAKDASKYTDKTYEFIVQNSADQYVKQDGSLSSTEATVSVKSGETVTIEGLDPDTYTVSEKTDAGLVSIAGYNFKTAVVEGDGKVKVGSESVVTITNTYEKQTGSLKLKKVVSGVEAEDASKYTDKTYEFIVRNSAGKYVDEHGNLSNTEVTVSVKDGETVTINGLDLGTYTVSEKTDAGLVNIEGYTFVGATGAGRVEVVFGTAEKTITNTYEKPTVPETTPVETTPAETTVPETTPAETTTPSGGGGGGGEHPHPLPETTPAETTPAETTVPETTPVETTTPGGSNGGNHGPSEEVETDEYGRVRGANRNKNKKGQDGGNVKGASRGKTRTGDESMMSIFGFGFLAAVLVLLGWFGIRFTKRNRR